MKTTPIVIMLAVISGFSAWLISKSLGATNPSLNGIVFGGFLAVIMIVEDAVKEIQNGPNRKN